MPFTISHAAVAFPSSRLLAQPLVTLGLIVGSMAPDAEYLLQLRPKRSLGHTLGGSLSFCLPVGLACAWLWEQHIAPELHFLIASSDAPPPSPRRPWSGRHLVDVAIAIVVGSVSHLGWDAVTHDWGWPVRRWSVMRYRVRGVRGFTHPVYAYLQQFSSLVGLVILLAWSRPNIAAAWTACARDVAGSGVRRRAWLALSGGVLVGAALNGLWSRWRLGPNWTARRALSFALVGGMAAGVVCVGALALSRWLWRRVAAVNLNRSSTAFRQGHDALVA